jgi:hypothetical protein
MSETVLFEDGGVKITPLTMTVEKGAYWSSSNEQKIEPLRTFPLNGVTEIRCVTINTSPLSEVWRKLRDWKRIVFYVCSTVAAVVCFLIPDWLSLAPNTDARKTFIYIGIALVICAMMFLVLDILVVSASKLAEGDAGGYSMRWKPIIAFGAVYFVVSQINKWSQTLGLIGGIALFLVVIVWCFLENPKHVDVRICISLVRGGQEVICYEEDLGPGGYYEDHPCAGERDMKSSRVEFREKKKLRTKQIVEILGAAIGQR